jgi:membrane protease YdiL (CAAX protease family)
MKPNTITTYKSALSYFALVYVLAIPFWALGALSKMQLLPALPISALGVLCPLTAASILLYRKNGWSAVVELLKRSFDFQRIRNKLWYLPTILLMPVAMLLSYLVMRLTGMKLPVPQISLTTTLALSVVFFIGGIAEELGWTGYAIDPLQERFGALRAALLLGAVWAVWHFIPLLSVPRSPVFIAWWTLGTISFRVIMTWLYNNTGKSVFSAVIFHAMINLTWQLFPINGSYYDPQVTSLIVAAAALIVVLIWGPSTLRLRNIANKSSEQTV